MIYVLFSTHGQLRETLSYTKELTLFISMRLESLRTHQPAGIEGGSTDHALLCCFSV